MKSPVFKLFKTIHFLESIFNDIKSVFNEVNERENIYSLRKKSVINRLSYFISVINRLSYFITFPLSKAILIFPVSSTEGPLLVP
jgi:hypothetical protein